MAAALLKSDLEVPHPLPRLFSLCLFWAIGFKGGVEPAGEGFSTHAVLSLLVAVGLPLYMQMVTRFDSP